MNRIWLLAVGLIAVATLTWLGGQPGTWRAQPELFAGGALVIGACMLLGLWLVRRFPTGRSELAWILTVSAVMLGLGMRLAPSDDVYRYVVEGRQLLVGQNPFLVPPAAAEARALVPPEISAGVNHPEMTAIYPPVALALHAGVQAVSPGIRGFQVLAAGLAAACVVLTTWLLQRSGRNPALVIALAWNPVLPIFIAGEAHHDIAMALLVLLAVAAANANRPWTAVVATGLAALTKPFALALVPALLPAIGWRRWLLLPLLAVLAYLPFSEAGTGLGASFATYAGLRHFHGVVDPWLRALLSGLLPPSLLEPALRVLLGGVLLGGGWWLHQRTRALPLAERAVAFVTLLLLCLPTIHPWYFAILTVLLPFSRSWALPLWTAGAGIYWLHGIRIQETGAWSESPWVTTLAHLPFLAVLLWECRGPHSLLNPRDAHV